MKIKNLNKEKYAGKRFTVKYMSSGYYDIKKEDAGFKIEYILFEKPIEKSFDDIFLSEWLDEPIAYGIFEKDKLVGYVEGSLEKWNNRFRISNICIFDSSYRNKGMGSILLDIIFKEAKSNSARMVVLETQSCNDKAISFYRKNGFEIIGFDLYAYSNDDIKKHEIRIEMGKRI